MSLPSLDAAALAPLPAFLLSAFGAAAMLLIPCPAYPINDIATYIQVKNKVILRS